MQMKLLRTLTDVVEHCKVAILRQQLLRGDHTMIVPDTRGGHRQEVEGEVGGK
jgi:hypothetical protein